MILRCPATGFADLDAKIAFGIARLAMEASPPGSELWLRSRPGYYEVEVDAEDEELGDAWSTLRRRLLAAEHNYFVPGLPAKYRAQYLPEGRDQVQKDLEARNPASLYSGPPALSSGKPIFGNNLCGHDDVTPFGGSAGLLLAASPHAGKPYKRDKVQSDSNLRLCAFCGMMVILASRTAVFRLSMGQARGKTVVLTPVPQEDVNGRGLAAIFAAQKNAIGGYVPGDIPVQCVPLVFFATYPHTADLLAGDGGAGGVSNAALHAVIFDTQARDRIVGSLLAPAGPAAKFVSDSPFNVATVRRLTTGRNVAVEPLTCLARLLSEGDVRARRSLACQFARSYVAELSGDGPPAALHGKTAKYMLNSKEVCDVPDSIIENEGVDAVARCLRYFVSAQNYGYVDDVRNARDAPEVKRTLVKMLREAWTRSQDKGQKYTPYVPSPTQLRQVTSLLDDPATFEETKVSLAILGLARWEKSADVAEVPPVEAPQTEIPDEEGDR